MDPYTALGVDRRANPDAVRAAYRDAVRRWHPDRDPSPQARAKFLAAQQAWEILGDPKRRAEFDRSAHPGAAEVFFVKSAGVRKTVMKIVRGGQAVVADLQARRRGNTRNLE